MEENCETLAQSLVSDGDMKTVLFPGYFDNLNSAATRLIQEAKASFAKVHLIIGLINDKNSVRSSGIHTLVDNISKIKEVDEVIILESKPTVDYLNSLGLDYVATADPEEFRGFGKVVRLDGGGLEDSRVIKDFENDVKGLLASDNGRLARAAQFVSGVSINCKKKLKNLKKSVWKSPFSFAMLENAIDRSRKYLQETFAEWGERRERILRNWMNKYKASTAVLVKLLREVWENA